MTPCRPTIPALCLHQKELNHAELGDLLEELKRLGSQYDILRRKHLGRLAKYTGRNVIIYYSAWLQKPDLHRQRNSALLLTDADKNGFMTAVHKMDRSKGLDLLLHTPGGEMAATESLIEYLRAMFGTDIRAIVPQLAMSAGTLVALACKQIIMGKQSSLGPIDPQIGGIPAHGVLEEFERAHAEVAAVPHFAHIWQPIIAKYTPAFVGECEKASRWADEMARQWMQTGMFEGDPDAGDKINTVMTELGEHPTTYSHARHFSAEKAKGLGLNIYELEKDNKLQDLVLSVHHATILTLEQTPTLKIIENNKGHAFVSRIQATIVPVMPPGVRPMGADES